MRTLEWAAKSVKSGRVHDSKSFCQRSQRPEAQPTRARSAFTQEVLGLVCRNANVHAGPKALKIAVNRYCGCHAASIIK